MEDVYIYLFAEWIAEHDFLAVEYYSAFMPGDQLSWLNSSWFPPIYSQNGHVYNRNIPPPKKIALLMLLFLEKIFVDMAMFGTYKL